MAEPDADRTFEIAQREFLRMAAELQRFAPGQPVAVCSFCERREEEVAAMVEGARARICDSCLRAALALINQT